MKRTPRLASKSLKQIATADLVKDFIPYFFTLVFLLIMKQICQGYSSSALYAGPNQAPSSCHLLIFTSSKNNNFTMINSNTYILLIAEAIFIKLASHQQSTTKLAAKRKNTSF